MLNITDQHGYTMKDFRSEAAANTALQQATEKNNGAGHREQAASWMQPSKTQRNTARAVKPLSTAEKVLRMLRSR